MKGATLFWVIFSCRFDDFNPRAREGRDLATFKEALRAMYFNPRAREGRDGNVRNGSLCSFNISIHAPVKGATVMRKLGELVGDIFQSTRP